MSKFAVNHFEHTLAIDLCRAAGIPPEKVSRLTLDLELGKPGRLNIETFADDSLIQVTTDGTGIIVHHA